MKFVFGGIALLVVAILLSPTLHMNLLGAILIVVFGFLFVTVSSRLTGEIGSSSNPISGMTVATLLLTCLIFLLIGWTGASWYVTALSVGGIVCIAASNGGSTSQDLKTGYLVGATPRYQQIAILIGSLLSALLLGPILLKLNDAATVYVPVAQVSQTAIAVDANALGTAKHEKIRGAQASSDTREFRVWQKRDDVGGPAGKYLVDENGAAVWFVDPGINGAYSKRPDGTEVHKFDAPKATLMSYIIKGILDRKEPPQQAAATWIAANPDKVRPWLEGVLRRDGSALNAAPRAAAGGDETRGFESWVASHKLPVGDRMTTAIDFIKTHGRGFFDGISLVIGGAVESLTRALLAMPALLILLGLAQWYFRKPPPPVVHIVPHCLVPERGWFLPCTDVDRYEYT